MPLAEFIHQMLPAVEAELINQVSQADGPGLAELHQMLAYHLGWQGLGAGPDNRGKRIRPLLVLLTAAAAGGDWPRALPAAAAVELIHNFSLIHDDIEDNSPLRRGRPTVWKTWGLAQGVNAGDTMFALANLAVLRLAETVSIQAAFEASRILQETCLKLTQGQYLDISFEGRSDLELPEYFHMIGGKTAALLSACGQLGALAAQAGQETRTAYGHFCWSLGLAFQAQDDILGIWGNAALTGKSIESDLLSGKKSLPVLYGLSLNGPFARRWKQGALTPPEILDLACQLEAEGARSYTQTRADELTKEALASLDSANPQMPAGAALRSLTLQLLQRRG